MSIILALILAAAPSKPDARGQLLDAMNAELNRSQADLKMRGHDLPYFISYQLLDTHELGITGRYGALFEDRSQRDRKLYVDVRVGSYAFDNSIAEAMDFNMSLKGQSFVSAKNGPLDDDALALRRALWLVTDEKYKSALVNYLKKKGDDVYTVDDPKRPASFSREKAVTFVEPVMAFDLTRERWTKIARELSAKFNSYPQLFDAEVSIDAGKQVRYFVSTEGTRLLTEEALFAVHVTAVTRADDGQLLDISRDFYAPTEAGLPSNDALEKQTDQMIQDLLALRSAPAIDPYTGPAIIEPEAAGVLFHETLGHRLEGDRQHDDTEGKTFKGQVGRKVLPDFISLFDDPKLATYQGKPLNGFYRYDDEGIEGQRTQLVERGVLKNYLLSRHPVEGFTQSNGHGRSQGNRKPVARMANLVVESSRQLSDSELKKQLVAEAKRQNKSFGLIIRDITGGDTNTSSFGYQAFRGVPRMVYRVDVRDGKETLVRGVEIVGTPLSSLNRIIATGKVARVFNGFCGAESGYVPVSAIAPATLIQEIELQRVMEGKDRPPILAPPVR